jgi:hypothetical protein
MIKEARRRVRNAHANVQARKEEHAVAAMAAQVALFSMAIDLAKHTSKIEQSNPKIKQKISMKKVLLRKEKIEIAARDENAVVDSDQLGKYLVALRMIEVDDLRCDEDDKEEEVPAGCRGADSFEAGPVDHRHTAFCTMAYNTTVMAENVARDAGEPFGAAARYKTWRKTLDMLHEQVNNLRYIVTFNNYHHVQ